MALFSVASAKGSPGVSLTAMALACTWPTDPLVADLDPAGGDFALRCRTPEGEPLSQDRGLLSLAAAVRRGAADADLGDHVQEIGGDIEVLAGLASPTQGTGLGAAWGQLPAVFRGAERDVIADCGRVVPGAAVMPVLAASDAVLFVLRPTVEATAHLRDRLMSLRDQLSLGAPDGVPVGIALVTSHKDRQSAGDLQRLLDSAGLPVQVLGVIAEDAKAATVLRGQATARIGSSLLIRSAADVSGRLHALAEHRLAALR
jgi:MinD-like ATPase involved in chromosome partitioning or flagellar assembly